MKVYLDGQKITIFPWFMKKIGEGLEGKVYLYKNEALKLYRYPGMQTGSLTLKDALYLKNYQQLIFYYLIRLLPMEQIK